jgi:hypothetical protein
MEELQKLYDVLVREGKYSKSFEEFKSKWSQDKAYKDKVYDVVTSGGFYGKDKNSFLQKYSTLQPVVKKKDSSVSATQQTQVQNTTVSPSAGGSLATQEPIDEPKTIGSLIGIDPDSNFNKAGDWLNALMSKGTVSVMQFADNLIVSARKGLQEEGFFDDDIPDTNTPLTDAMKKKATPKKGEILTLDPKYTKPQSDGGPLDPTPLIKGAANLYLKIINSTLPQDKKNVIIAALNLGDAEIKNKVKLLEKYQEEKLDKSLVTKVLGGISSMAPDLAVAALMKNPTAVEGKFAKWGAEVSKDAKPLIAKYVPKATKFIEEAVNAPFTKIMAAKGTAEGIANAEEGEDIVDAAIEGTLEGGAEGIYMHALGVAAGGVMPKIAKVISKTGLDSKFATAIANPLANAGVFSTAKAIRTPIETGEFATAEELALEAGTGIGFSLLHAGSLYKTQNEANHFYDNVLKTDPLESFGRVINETKDNLELVYNPDLTPSQIIELESARDQLKKAIIKEPDLNNKKLLGDEALKIQNQLDAHSAIKGIVENKEAIIEAINTNENLSEEIKAEKTKKVAAIADYFDTSEFSLKKKELNTRINEAQKKLDDSALAFTNLKNPSDRIEAKIEVEKRKAEVEDLNNQLTELITNKVNQDAVQIESTAEIPVQSETGVSETMEGRTPETKPEVVTEQTTKEKIDQARIDRRIKNKDLTKAEGSTFDEDMQLKNAKVGDEFNFEEYKDGEFKSYDTKVKEIVDGKIIFENGKTQDDISSYSNKTAEDAWFDKNYPELTLEKPKEVVTEEKTIITEKPKVEEDIDLTLPENKDNIIISESSNGFILIDSNTKQPVEVFNEKAGENSGVSKPYATQEGAQARIEEIKQPTITDKPKAVVEPLKDVESTANTLNEIGGENDLKNELAKKIDDKINLLRDENGEISDANLPEFKALKNAKESINRGVILRPEGGGMSSRNLDISKEYHKAKEDGSNPELVKAVEELLAPKVEEPTNEIVLDIDAAEKRIAEEKLNEVKDLLDLDTKDKTNLQRVSDYLDKLDKSLDINPNELNDVTRVMAVGTAKAVIKTLKALVDTGVTLQEAIKMASAVHKVKEDQIVEALDVVSKLNENKSEGISEIELPGYNKLSKAIDKAITNGKTIDNALNYLNRSEVYKRASDIQKESLVREVRKRFGLKEKAAPSVNRLFGKIKDIAKVTMTEKAGLVKQIKDAARGARQSIQEWKKQTKELTDELKELNKLGKITLSQQTAVLDRFGKVNIFSEKSINRFTDYVTKVFADANYKEKLNTARKNLSSIKRLSKNEEKNGDLRALGVEFVKIDPSIVENIDKYNDLSSKIKDAIDGSKIRKSNVSFAETVNIEKATEYIEKTLEEQDKKLREEKIAELQDLLGVDAKDFNAEEIDALLESDKDLSKDDIKIVRSTIKKGFDVYTSVVKEMLSTGEDPFTGEDVSFDKKQEDLVKRFIDIDPNKIQDPKEALRTVDALINFIQNKSTAGMLKPIADYEAIKGGDEAIATGLKAIRIRKYFNEKLGRALGQKTTTLPVLGEKMFKGVNRSLDFEELVGVSDLINNSSKAESETNLIAKDYIKEFYKRKANGEVYNSAYNDIERGVLAHITRNVIGLEPRMKKVFEKRKQEVLETVDLLSSKGNDSEQEFAKLIKKAYDKILDGSKNIKDAKDKADVNNVEGVNYWINQWSKRYEALSDLSLNFYNKVLGKDLGYTPDKVVKLQDKREDVDLEDTKSQFFANTDEILYDKKSGTLMDKQEDRTIPKDMYIDFSFDKKNGNAMSDALTDLYTAFDIRKVGSFLKSDNFNKIIPSSRDANLYDKRIKKFVKITRRKTPFQNSEVSDLIKKADRLAKLGITMSLASGRQPFIQSIPVMVSTAINAGGVNPIIGFEPKYSKWLQDLGYAVSNRGVESQGQLESMNKLLEKAADMPLDKAMKFIEKIQDESLKLLLVKGDVAVARAAFKAYYEQSLKQQGLYKTVKTTQTDSGERTVETKGIDYSDHEPNKKAANYAQRMVDRQQNISNPALAGDLFTSESTASKIFIKMLMPFSSFRMNQSARLGSDLSTLEYWNTSTKQDKIIALKSIAGYTAEAATYRALQIGAGLLFTSIASAIMGKDDEKEDKKSLDNSIKSAAQGAFVDTFSPIPLADPFTQDALVYTAEELQDVMDIPEKEKIKLFEAKEQSALKMLGTYGIPITKAKEIYDLGKLAYTKKYKDKYGNEKKISQENADKLKVLIAPLIAVTAIGAFSPDISAITKKAIKMSQKNGGKGMSKEEIKKKDPQMYKIMYGND